MLASPKSIWEVYHSAICYGSSGRRLHEFAQQIGKVQDAFCGSHGVDKLVRQSIQAVCNTLQKQLERIDQQLQDAFEETPAWREKDNSLRSVPDQDYPTQVGTVGFTTIDDFFVEIRAQATLQPGTYQINVGSDDGGYIGCESLPVPNPMGFDGTPPQNFLAWYNGTRGHGNTTGTITVSQPTTTTFHAMFFERGGGDSGEFSIRDASGGSVAFNTNDFQLIENGVLGIDFTASLDMLDVNPMPPTFVGGEDSVQKVEMPTSFENATFLPPVNIDGVLITKSIPPFQAVRAPNRPSKIILTRTNQRFRE